MQATTQSDPNLLFEQLDKNQVGDIATRAGLSIKLRSTDSVAWGDVLNSCHYVPVGYTTASMEYQLAYHSGQGGLWKDLSLVIYWDNSPAAVWPFTLSLTKGQISMSSQGLALTAPLIKAGLARSSEHSIVKLSMDFAHRLAQMFHLKSFDSCDVFSDRLGLSNWYLEGMTRGANCRVQHEIFLKTSDSWDEIQKSYKKRLRYSMNQAARLWKSFILNGPAPELDSVWNAFKDLHIQVSGRQTRSDDSWAIQQSAIRRGEAFLVCLLDIDENMVGGGYFTLSANEALYAVGVYDRALFDKPVGYLVQYAAIQELVRRGIRWYKLGALPFESDIPPPTPKDISIGAFKKHFSSHTFPRMILNHPLSVTG